MLIKTKYRLTWNKLIVVFVTLLTSIIYSQSHQHNTFFDIDTLNINNIRMISSNIGNSDGYGGFWEVLAPDWDQSIMYDQGPWLVGKIGSDTVVSLSQWLSTYSPGPIISGQAAMLIHPEDSLRYRSYKISKGDDNTNPDYAEWPVDFGAPVDNQGNPLIHGDQTLWTVFNSLDSNMTNSNWWQRNPLPIPVEFRQMIFSRDGSELDESDIFANTVFMEWVIINKGNLPIDSAFFGFWTDIDFDNYSENRPGVDTIRQLGYCWSNQTVTFNDSIPPAVGYCLLYGPVVQSPGNTATFKGRQLANYENLNMSSYHGIGDDSWWPPYYSMMGSISDAWNFARGLDEEGNIIIDPVSNNSTKFTLAGDPVTGQGWIFETGTGGGAGFAFFSGPFTLAPNDTQWTLVALIPAKGQSNLNSITQLRRKAEILQSLPYDSLAFGTLNYPITDVKIENPIVEEFKLYQNYPNPFNPSTKIKFTIPTPPESSPLSKGRTEEGFVSLKIYDILGNEITTLINEELSPGEYEVTFDVGTSRDLSFSSGIYFYTLKAGSFAKTKKMILMK
jgi:hypothetical protein